VVGTAIARNNGIGCEGQSKETDGWEGGVRPAVIEIADETPIYVAVSLGVTRVGVVVEKVVGENLNSFHDADCTFWVED
jgi:hypothetical protein